MLNPWQKLYYFFAFWDRDWQLVRKYEKPMEYRNTNFNGWVGEWNKYVEVYILEKCAKTNKERASRTSSVFGTESVNVNYAKALMGLID
jgi:hypothetical protein